MNEARAACLGFGAAFYIFLMFLIDKVMKDREIP
jgi:hypothetical protein